MARLPLEEEEEDRVSLSCVPGIGHFGRGSGVLGAKVPAELTLRAKSEVMLERFRRRRRWTS